MCAQPSTYISLHGDNVWDWHVVIGWMTGKCVCVSVFGCMCGEPLLSELSVIQI